MKLPYQFIRESCGNSPEEAWARLINSERADIDDGIQVEFPIISKADALLIKADYSTGKAGINIIYQDLQHRVVYWIGTPRDNPYTFIGWITE